MTPSLTSRRADRGNLLVGDNPRRPAGPGDMSDGEFAGTVAWWGTPRGRDDAALMLLDDPHWVPTAEAEPWGEHRHPSNRHLLRLLGRAEPRAGPGQARGGQPAVRVAQRGGPDGRRSLCTAVGQPVAGRSVAVGLAVRRRRVLHSCWPSINHPNVSSRRGRRTVSGSLPAGDLHSPLEAFAGGLAGCGGSRAVQLSGGRRLPA